MSDPSWYHWPRNYKRPKCPPPPPHEIHHCWPPPCVPINTGLVYLIIPALGLAVYRLKPYKNLK
jgi:hypothetical protein